MGPPNAVSIVPDARPAIVAFVVAVLVLAFDFDAFGKGREQALEVEAPFDILDVDDLRVLADALP